MLTAPLRENKQSALSQYAGTLETNSPGDPQSKEKGSLKRKELEITINFDIFRLVFSCTYNYKGVTIKHFRSYLVGKYNRNNPKFKFNTYNTSFKIGTYFYISPDGIHNYNTYSKLNAKDHREILKFLYDHRSDIMKIYDGINSELITDSIFRVNSYYYNARDHVQAIREFRMRNQYPPG